jgi:hypothetical protein
MLGHGTLQPRQNTAYILFPSAAHLAKELAIELSPSVITPRLMEMISHRSPFQMARATTKDRRGRLFAI